LLATRGDQKNLSDALTASLFAAEKVEIQRRSDKTIADLMASLIKGNENMIAATGDQSKVTSAMDKIGGAIDAVVTEMKEAGKKAPAQLNVASAPIAIPSWVYMRTADATLKDSYSRNLITPSGGSLTVITGSGTQDLIESMLVWDPELVTCNFEGSDKKKYTGPTRLVSLEKGKLFVPCESVEDCDRVALACVVPKIPAGVSALVTLTWNGNPTKTLKYEGVPKSNTVYSAEYLSGWSMITVGSKKFPQAKGVGFSSSKTYHCKYYSQTTKSSVYNLPATYVDSNTLHCDQPLMMDAKNPIAKEYEASTSSFFAVGVALMSGKDAVAVEKPKAFPGKAGKALDLRFRVSDMMCTDGVKQPYEIGVDCGKSACNKYCPPLNLAKGAACDRKEDCRGDCKGGKCTFQPASCSEIFAGDSSMKSGLYDLVIDRKYSKNRGDNDLYGSFKAYCDVSYNRQTGFKGAWTLVQTIASNQHWNNYYNAMNQNNDYRPDLGKQWAANNKNRAARLGLEKWNSIFKHSLGVVMTRYANNQANYQFTDVYATPEKNQHIYDSDHKCGDRSGLDIARAYRKRDDASMGYCFHLGQKKPQQQLHLWGHMASAVQI